MQNSTLWSLAVICHFHQIAMDAPRLLRKFSHDGQSLDINGVILAARSLGLKAQKLPFSSKALPPDEVLPVITVSRNGDCNVLARLGTSGSTRDSKRGSTGSYLLQGPGDAPRKISYQELAKLDVVHFVAFREKQQFWLKTANTGFSLKWFIPALVKYRRLFFEVLVASFFLQLFALATPLFFQVVMDKVLVHKAFTTLNVLAIAFLGIAVFELLLGSLRHYIYLHTASRVDVELGARLYQHLMGLPLSWFAHRRTGQTVAHVRELENIRNFITGSALTLVVDVLFAGLFIALMAYYSTSLTLVVLAVLPLFLVLAIFVTPILRHRLDEKFHYGAENQAFLVESLGGMPTIKSMAIESRMHQQWNMQLASYTRAAFRVQNLSNIASQLAGFFNKLMTLGIVWWGAHLVMAGQITVGQLVAFNMLAARLSSPIIKLVQLWQDFQQAGISIKRLNDILGSPLEPGVTDRQSMKPEFAGHIEYDQVSFRYRLEAPLQLDNISLDICPGEIIGIVGESGSGKSTLASLLQGLYQPESGRIRIDGVDVSALDPMVLREKVGVVMQENTLFSRTVRENIALASPAMPVEKVIHAAKLAGAHEFIGELPMGYDTVLEEQGSNLSGGQRQRLAIARVLATDPAILVFDEATSALDAASEHRIQQNMAQICKGRSTIIIAHRLATVRACHRILVMKAGKLVEQGSHTELLQQNGAYARLHRLQHQPANDAKFTSHRERRRYRQQQAGEGQ